jgi:hypothetical protein
MAPLGRVLKRVCSFYLARTNTIYCSLEHYTLELKDNDIFMIKQIFIDHN